VLELQTNCQIKIKSLNVLNKQTLVGLLTEI